MLLAYFDDSGTHANSAVTLIAGLVASAVTWARIEGAWKQHLSVTGVSHFHAVDCENGSRKFSSVSRPLRDSLSYGLSEAICSHQRAMVLLGSAVKTDDWEVAAPKEITNRFVDPYYFCFEACLQQISNWSVRHADGEIVTIVFAQRGQYDSRLIELHELYSKSSALPNNRLGSLSFSSPKDSIPLQAADLIAYETYRYAATPVTTRSPTLRRAFQNFVQAGMNMHGLLHDRETLKRLRPNGFL